MRPKVLFVVSGDPRASGRPAEAIRIAAGIGTWKQVEVNLYLSGPAVLSLSPFRDEYIDEEHYRRYLPLFGDFGGGIYVERGNPMLAEIGEATVPFELMGIEALASFSAGHRYLVRF